MDRIECMRAFVETVRSNGFSAAARALDAPRSRISKRVQVLEDMLGVQLLVRTTRSLSLTVTGTDYYEQAVEVLSLLDRAEQKARDDAAQLGGVLRVDAPTAFGVRILAPLLPAFHAEHPGVRLQVALGDQPPDPVKSGRDVSIRIAALPDSNLVARQVMPAPRTLVAAPCYLARAGVPRTPEELADHAWLGHGGAAGDRHLLLTRGSERRRIRVDGPLAADNGDLLAEAAAAGMGIALLPDFIVGDRLRDGRLVPVLPEWRPPAIAVHAVYPATPRLPRRTRRFIDFLVARLGPARGDMQGAALSPARRHYVGDRGLCPGLPNR